MAQFYNFCQKPSLWVSSVRNKLNNVKIPYSADLITNDWDPLKYDYYTLPPQDSLKSCSKKTRKTFIYNFEKNANKAQQISTELINEDYIDLLNKIKTILDKNQTNYHIVISPAPCRVNPQINPNDLLTLQTIFGANNVHNYSSCNEYTEDYNNFSDPGHFGLRIGYFIFNDIYN